jgi:hypothetical protein
MNGTINILDYDMTIYSYKKINVNASVTYVNVMVIDAHYFGYSITGVKMVKILKYSDQSLHFKLAKYTKNKIAYSF